MRALVESEAPVVTLVAKSHVGHVERALRTTLDENLAMVARHSRRSSPARAAACSSTPSTSSTATAATRRTRSRWCGQRRRPAPSSSRCATRTAGMLPDDVGEIVAAVDDGTGVRLGIHCHNDTGCAVANSLAAVDAGATHVQGTLNGYGERTGNADLVDARGQPRAQARPAGAAGRRAARGDPDRARGLRGHQRRAVLAAALRRRERLRAQGRPARECDQGRSRPLPAHRPDAGRQRHADAGLGHGGPGEHRAQGPRARLRPVRPTASSSAGSPTG